MRSRYLAPLLLLGAIPAVSANPLVDLVVAVDGFVDRLSVSGSAGYSGMLTIAFFIAYLLLFHIAFKVINKNNEKASPRLVNAGIIIFSAVLALFTASTVTPTALAALAQQFGIFGALITSLPAIVIVAGCFYIKQRNSDNYAATIGAGIVLITASFMFVGFVGRLEEVGALEAAWWINLVRILALGTGIWWTFSPIISLIRGDDNMVAGRRGAGNAWQSRPPWLGGPQRPPRTRNPRTQPNNNQRGGNQRTRGPQHFVSGCSVGGVSCHINYQGIVVDNATGAPHLLNPGDVVRFQSQTTTSRFNHLSKRSRIRFIEFGGSVAHEERLRPTLADYAHRTGGGLSNNDTMIEFSVRIPNNLPAQSYKVHLRLETV